MLNTGIGHKPRPGEPESALEPGMSAPRQRPRIVPQRALGAIWEESGVIYRQTPRGPVVLVPDPPNVPGWAYDFNPATGNARAQWNGEIAMTGSATLNGSALSTGAASVLSFNTRTGAVTPQAGDYTAAQVGAIALGAAVPNTNPVSQFITGTVAADNAAAGVVGEVMSASLNVGSATALTTGVGKNVVQIALTAGDWDVDATLAFVPAATTTVGSLGGGISVSSGVAPAQGVSGAVYDYMFNSAINVNLTMNTARIRLNINAGANLFLVAFANFATSTLGAAGTIYARRVR